MTIPPFHDYELVLQAMLLNSVLQNKPTVNGQKDLATLLRSVWHGFPTCLWAWQSKQVLDWTTLKTHKKTHFSWDGGATTLHSKPLVYRSG